VNEAAQLVQRVDKVLENWEFTAAESEGCGSIDADCGQN